MSVNTLTLNKLVAIFRDISIKHDFINSFNVGPNWNISQPENKLMPMMFLEPLGSTVKGGKTAYMDEYYKFNIYILDRISKGDSNYMELMSDCDMTLKTIIGWISQHQYYIDNDFELVENVESKPIWEETVDNLNGWVTTLTIKCPMRYTPCNDPIQPITGYTVSLASNITEYRLVGSVGPIGPTGPTGPAGDGGLPQVLAVNNNPGTYSIFIDANTDTDHPFIFKNSTTDIGGGYSIAYADNPFLHVANLNNNIQLFSEGITLAAINNADESIINIFNDNGISIQSTIGVNVLGYSPTFPGVLYDSDYSANFLPLSLINKGYADSHYLTQSIINGLEQVLLVGNTFSTNTIVFDNSITNNTTALYQDINTGIGYYIGIGDNIDLSNASNYALMSFYINNGIDILSNSGGININTPNDNIIINANRLVNITSGNGLVLQNNSTNAATYKSSGTNNLISTSDTNIISNTNINLISNTINIATSSVINSYNGGGQLALDAGGVPGVIALSLDKQAYNNAYLYLSTGGVDGYTNFIDLVGNITSTGGVTGQVNIGLYATDVTAYESYSSYNNTSTATFFKANQFIQTDGNALIQPNFTNGSTGTIQMNGVGNMMNHKLTNVATGSNPLDAVNVSQLKSATSSLIIGSGTAGQVAYFLNNNTETSSSSFTFNNGVPGIAITASGSVVKQMALGYTVAAYNSLNNIVTPLLIKCTNGLSTGGLKMQSSSSNNDVFVVQDWGNNLDSALYMGSSIQLTSTTTNNSHIGNKLSVGTTISPSAYLMLGTGLSSSSNAPLKFNGTSSVQNLLNILENGAVEFDGTNLYWTGTASGVQNRYKILGQTGSNLVNQVPVFSDANQVKSYSNFTFDGTLYTLLSATNSAQIKQGYNSSNYYTTQIGSTGIVTYTATGASGEFIFANQTYFQAASGISSAFVQNVTNNYYMGFQAPSNGGNALISTINSGGISLAPLNVVKLNLTSSGLLFVGGSTTPTAILHLLAGGSASSTSPLKFTSGSLLTTPEAGAIEYDGTSLYYTDSTPTRQTIATTASVQTLTNKRITLRSGSEVTNTASMININSFDVWNITGLSSSNTISVTGSATDGQQLLLTINGTASQPLSFSSSSNQFNFSTYLLSPTQSTAGKILISEFKYSKQNSKWNCVGYADGF